MPGGPAGGTGRAGGRALGRYGERVRLLRNGCGMPDAWALGPVLLLMLVGARQQATVR